MYLPRLFALQTSLRVYTKAACSKELPGETPIENASQYVMEIWTERLMVPSDPRHCYFCFMLTGLFNPWQSLLLLPVSRRTWRQTIHGSPVSTKAWDLHVETAWLPPGCLCCERDCGETSPEPFFFLVTEVSSSLHVLPWSSSWTTWCLLYHIVSQFHVKSQEQTQMTKVYESP